MTPQSIDAMLQSEPRVNDPIADRVVECILWAYNMLVVAVRIAKRRIFRYFLPSSDVASPGAPIITKVYAFCDDDPPSIEDEPDWTDFQDIPVKEFSPGTWEDDVRARTEWSTFHVELRYVYMDKKYRIVLCHGDDAVAKLSQPARHVVDRGGGGRARMRMPRGVLSARLIVRNDLEDEKATDIDITSRVKKYSGPRGDFSDSPVRVRDLFPFDDHESNAERYAGVRIIDAWGKASFFSYIDNDVISLATYSSSPSPAPE